MCVCVCVCVCARCAVWCAVSLSSGTKHRAQHDSLHNGLHTSQGWQLEAVACQMLSEAKSQLAKYVLGTRGRILTPGPIIWEETSAHHDAHSVCSKRLVWMAGRHMRYLMASTSYSPQVYAAWLLFETHLLLLTRARSPHRVRKTLLGDAHTT